MRRIYKPAPVLEHFSMRQAIAAACEIVALGIFGVGFIGMCLFGLAPLQ